MDKYLNLLLNHSGVGFEHVDVSDNVSYNRLEPIGLLSLHDLYNVSLHDELAFLSNLLLLLRLFFGHLGSLLLYHLLRNQIAADSIRLEVGIYRDLLLLSKDGLFDFFVEDLDLGVAESHHCWLELLFSDCALLFDLRTGEHVSLVEEAQYGGLEDVGDQLVPLRSVGHLQLD